MEKLHGEMWTIVLMHKRHERAFHVRARVCLSVCHWFVVCVVCVSVFVLCVCPPFLKREAMLCVNVKVCG